MILVRTDRVRAPCVRLASIALVACCLLAFRSAKAADTNDVVAAEHLFQSGQRAASGGRWEEACRDFEESLLLDPAPGTRLNLADCEEHRGRLARAWQLFEDSSSALLEHDPRRALAAERAAQLAPRLPMLTVRVIGGIEEGAHVFRNDVELSPSLLGVSLPVDPGRYTIKLVVPGRRSRSEIVSIAERDVRTVSLEPGEVSDGARAHGEHGPGESKVPVVASSSPLRNWGLVVGGVGLASLTASGISGLLAMDANGRVSSHCNADRRCDEDGLRAADSARMFANAGTVTFICGAVALAAGVVLVLLGN